MITNWTTLSSVVPSVGWMEELLVGEPYRYHGVLASAMSSSMKPRARSGARARLSVLRADGVGFRVAVGRLGQMRVSIGQHPGRTDNT